SNYDVLHFHIDYLHFPYSKWMRLPSLTTLHGRLDIPDLAVLYKSFSEMPVISISDSQRGPLPLANWQATIYHGLPQDLFSFHPGPGRYLAFLGRISPEKRVDRAIRIADRLSMPLKVAAKIDKADRAYYESIKSMFDNPYVEYVGEIGGREKEEFLGNAQALLFPIDWPEPFGLAMIEAMACGTPVIAYRRASVPEIIREGVGGFIVDDIDGAVAAVERLSKIDRRGCRREFEMRFTAPRMAREYLAAYSRLLGIEDSRLSVGVQRAQSVAQV